MNTKSEQSDIWTVTLEQDGDDLILPLPQEILDALDISEGDVLEWIEYGNNAIALKKANNESQGIQFGPTVE